MELDYKKIIDKTIFLSGGTGFFGKNLLKYISDCGKNEEYKGKLFILSRNPDKFIKDYPELVNLSGLNFIQGDVRNFDYTSLPDVDFVIHAAAETDNSIVISKPDMIYSVIVDGTKQILKMCVEKKVSRLLYVSSGAVYGNRPLESLNISEGCSCKPSSIYGQGKLEAEKMCLASSIDTVIARCFSCVGPYLALDKHFAVGNFINDILHDQDIKIKGDGKSCRSYIYSSDLIEWLFALLLRGEDKEIYNVGSDEKVSIYELAETVLRAADTEKKIIIASQNTHSGTVPNSYIPDISKCLKLGLKIKKSLEESIKRTIDFNKNTNKKVLL